LVTLIKIETLNYQTSSIHYLHRMVNHLEKEIHGQQNKLSLNGAECLNQLIHYHTFCYSERMPHQILGTFSVVEEHKIFFNMGESIERVFNRRNQLKSDYLNVIDFIYDKYHHEVYGFIFKEDSFVTCISTNEIINIILMNKLEDKIVSLAYGFGLMYIPVGKLKEFIRLENNCRKTLDTCLYDRIALRQIVIKVHPPLAVHRNTVNYLNITDDLNSNCDWNCFVDCHDISLGSKNRTNILLNITDFYQNKGIKIIDLYNRAYCNDQYLNRDEDMKIGCR